VKTTEEYLEQARECRTLAVSAVLPTIRTFLLQMADRWEELARQRAAEKGLQDILAALENPKPDSRWRK
jgi:hypothetical protein